MKVASIVGLVNDNWTGVEFKYNEIKPVKDIEYVVRTYEDTPLGKAIRLEEIVNEQHLYPLAKEGYVMMEIAFSALRFRELLPPVDIEEMIKGEKEDIEQLVMY